MKHRTSAVILLAGLSLLGLTVLPLAADAQATQGNRVFNPFEVQFQRIWDFPLPDPVKLIEIGQVIDPKQNCLLLLIDGRDRDDYKRKLLITHWNGSRFLTDSSIEFLGTSVDALLAARVRAPKAPPTVVPAKGKSTPLPGRQIVTTEGIYEWTNGTFVRLFPAPAETKLAVTLDKASDQLLAGVGDRTSAFEVTETELRRSLFEPNDHLGGYARFGIGTQEFGGSEALNLVPGVRYVQSSWKDRNRWMIGLQRGTPAPTPNAPNATTGDRLVVYTPGASHRDRSFWATRASDMEESWRSDPLPGRVLDVRVGDPKNDGKDGILVLTAENNDRERHLYFYAIAQPGTATGVFPRR